MPTTNDAVIRVEHDGRGAASWVARHGGEWLASGSSLAEVVHLLEDVGWELLVLRASEARLRPADGA